MQIWSAEIKELEALYTFIKGRFPELEKELERLIKTDDENMVLLYSRRCLEVIVTDLCECELKRPRKTEPLKGIIDKLSHEEKVPSHIIASMQNLNTLSTFGAHPKEFDPEQVKPVLSNLTIIIKWYLKYKDTQSTNKEKPEEVKDETKTPDDSTEQQKKPKKKLILLLSGIAVVVVIIVVALFVFDIIGDGKQTEELEKSIAVLPFINDSPDEENVYFINGIMEEVLNNLQTIKDLKVISRSSVEQYRDPTRPTSPEIAQKLGVNYIVEGSGQKYGNTFHLRVQLIEAPEDKHLWAESYEQEIEGIKDIFRIQTRIAESIALELKAIITPEEKQLIEKTPTTSLTAYDFYQRGSEEYQKYLLDNDNKGALEKAEDLYHKALEYDSTFPQAYTGLAWIYWSKHYWQEYFSETFLDSVLILCDIALSYDSQVADAYIIKGNCYRAKGIPDKAMDEFDKALKINPNSWEAYYGIGRMDMDDDLVKSISYRQKAIALNHGSELPSMLRGLAWSYISAGFTEKAKYYYLEAFKLDGDSSRYYNDLANIEQFQGTYTNAIKFYEKANEIDSTSTERLKMLGMLYMFTGYFEESLIYYKKWILLLNARGQLDLDDMHRIGYAYWKNGYKKEGVYYFNKQMELCNDLIKSDRPYAQQLWAYYELAGVYAFRGDKDRAYENLKIFNQKQRMPFWMVEIIKNDPLFDSLRDEQEFQQIVRDVEAKYQAEHERIRKWLEEQGDLPG